MKKKGWFITVDNIDGIWSFISESRPYEMASTIFYVDHNRKEKEVNLTFNLN